jgi:hypothetical protein
MSECFALVRVRKCLAGILVAHVEPELAHLARLDERAVLALTLASGDAHTVALGDLGRGEVRRLRLWCGRRGWSQK